jgi:hypothetical protein
MSNGKRRLATVVLLASLSASLCALANAGIRAPGKYDGVVFFDRWGGCILFSGVYLMYISEDVKDEVRQYEGQAVEIEALEVFQPINPGDGLIRRLRVLGPAEAKQREYTVQGTKLESEPVAVNASSVTVALTITNEGGATARILSSEIGFALLSKKIQGVSTPSDGPSMAVITRTDLSLGKGTSQLGIADKIFSYSYLIADDLKFPRSFELAPHQSRSTQITFQLPAGHYQFLAGYGGGVHESGSIVSNPVSIDIGQ